MRAVPKNRCAALLLCFVVGAAAAMCLRLGMAQAEDSVGASADEIQHQAASTLRKAGLTLVSGHWVLHEEMVLRSELEELPKLERAFFRQRDKVRQLVRRYETLAGKKKQLEQTLKKNQQRLSSGQINALERKDIQEQNRRHARALSKIAEEIRKDLDGRLEGTPITREVVQLTVLQNRLTACVLSIGRLQQTLTERYATLSETPEVLDSLATLIGEARLGPLEVYATRERRRIEQISKSVFAKQVPCYVLSDGHRLGVIINEEVPATFTYQPVDNPTLIPASLAQAANLVVSPDAPPVILTQKLEKGERKILMRQVTIPSLRVGGTLLENVEAFVMGPEGEDLGARLGPAALKGYSLQVDPRRLTFRLTKKGS